MKTRKPEGLGAQDVCREKPEEPRPEDAKNVDNRTVFMAMERETSKIDRLKAEIPLGNDAPIVSSIMPASHSSSSACPSLHLLAWPRLDVRVNDTSGITRRTVGESGALPAVSTHQHGMQQWWRRWECGRRRAWRRAWAGVARGSVADSYRSDQAGRRAGRSVMARFKREDIQTRETRAEIRSSPWFSLSAAGNRTQVSSLDMYEDVPPQSKQRVTYMDTAVPRYLTEGTQIMGIRSAMLIVPSRALCKNSTAFPKKKCQATVSLSLNRKWGWHTELMSMVEQFSDHFPDVESIKFIEAGMTRN
ncbi:hypothetical protein B0H11DRAFT_1945449 [Mycena galericulata]|nr:hypothetical protein B0H11DRAFT_1945449 [Mycena galericulata]